MNRRRLALVAGLLALAVGVAVAASPGLLGLAVDRALVTALGVVTLLGAVRQVAARRGVDTEAAVTPTPEHRVPTPPPGEDLRDSLGGFLSSGRLPYNQAVRGLRAAAVEVLAQCRRPRPENNRAGDDGRLRVARETEHERPVGDAGRGPDRDDAGADDLEQPRPERLAETRQCLL